MIPNSECLQFQALGWSPDNMTGLLDELTKNILSVITLSTGKSDA